MRTRTMWPSLIVVCLLLLKAAAAAAECRVPRDEGQVYTALISDWTSSSSPYVVQLATDNSHFSSEFDLPSLIARDQANRWTTALARKPQGTWIFSGTPPGAIEISARSIQELQADYSSKLRQVCSINPGTVHNAGARILTLPERRALFPGDADPHKGWRKFHKRYGEAAVLVSLSRVAFDQQRHLAMVSVNSGIAAMGAGGAVYLLERVGSDWVVKAEYLTWTT